MKQKMSHPGQLYVFSCLHLVVMTLRSKKEEQLLGKAGVGWWGLWQSPAKRVCESPV